MIVAGLKYLKQSRKSPKSTIIRSICIIEKTTNVIIFNIS